MLKCLQEFQKTAYRILILLASVQVGLGVCWALCNMGTVQNFTETGELLEIADTMITDEYVGILYPVLIRVCKALEYGIPVPYYCYLYLLQLAVGYWAVYRLLWLFGCVHGKLAAAWILTIPTILQLQIAVLPMSLAVSLLVLCFVSFQKGDWAKGGVYWLLCGLMIPEYFLFAGLVFLCSLIRGLAQGEYRKRVLKKGILCLLFVCLAAGAVKGATQETYSRGRMARTPAAMALQRLVWPHYSTNSFFWTEEVKELFDQDALWNLAQNPELPLREFGPAIEAAYGLRRAQSIYWDMAWITFRMRTKEVAMDLVNDLVLYCAPAASLPRNLEGMGVSYSGWNYQRMAEHTPVLTRYYVLYGGNLAVVMLVLVLLSRLAGRVSEKKAGASKDIIPEGKAPGHRGKRVDFLLLCILQILWYTLSASGMQDYRNVVLVSIAWGLLIVCGFKKI